MSMSKIAQACYLLAATLSGGGVLLAGFGYFPALGTLLLIVAAGCLVLGLVLVSGLSDRDWGRRFPGRPSATHHERRENIWE